MGEDAAIDEVLPAYFGSHGMPRDKVEQLGEHMKSFHAQVAPLPEVTYVADGEWLDMGNKRWTTVETGDMPRGIFHFTRRKPKSCCAGMPSFRKFRRTSACSQE